MNHREQRAVRRLVATTGVVLALVVGSACGSGDNVTDTPTDNPGTDTTVLVKNMPRNNCVSVMSGERPPPGVTIPRCTPTGTIAPRPPRNRP